jgi:hypothetical protein
MATTAYASKPLKRTTSGSRLDAREVVVVGDVSKWPKSTTSGSCLGTREVMVVAQAVE